MTRLNRVFSALAITAVAVSGLPLVATQAVAAGTVQCTTAVPIFVRYQNGGLDLKTHNEPETGVADWGPGRGIGAGWTGQTRTGPNGLVHAITREGHVEQHRWNGAGWDDGGVSTRIATGWNGWGDAFARNRMTVDARGDFYGFPSDRALHWWRYDATAKTWSEKVIDLDWGSKYDLLWADGDGGLFARTPDGKLFRYTYHAESQRFTEYARQVGDAGWGQFSDVAGVGGGVFYALDGGTGQLKWYRYLGDGQWAVDAGKVVDLGWGADWQIEGSPDACRILGGPAAPTRPAITPAFSAPLALHQGDDDLVNYFFVNSQGRLTAGKQRRTDDLLLIDHQPFPGHAGFTGTPAFTTYPNGTLEVQAQSYEDTTVRGKSQDVENGVWKAGFTDLGGYFAGGPRLVRASDDLLVAFGVDADGKLWYRNQLVLWGAAEQGRFGAWRPLGGGTVTPDFSVLRNGNAVDVVARHTDGSFRVARCTGTALGPWRDAGGTDGTGAAAAVAHDDGTVQLVVRRADGRVHTRRETATGFTGAWEPVGTLTTSGSPSAVLTSRGTLELSVRGDDGLVQTTGQNQPGGAFRAWQVRDFNEAGTDTAMTRLNDDSWLVAWRDPRGEVYAYRGTYGSPTARAATTSADPVYEGGPTRS